MKRLMSDSQLSSLQAETNFNVNWMHGPSVWFMYLALIFAFRVICGLLLNLNPAQLWTLTNAVHAVVCVDICALYIGCAWVAV
jgi:hypothetical protein